MFLTFSKLFLGKLKEIWGNPKKFQETQTDSIILWYVRVFLTFSKLFLRNLKEIWGNPRKFQETRNDFIILWYVWVFLTFSKLFLRKLKEIWGNPRKFQETQTDFIISWYVCTDPIIFGIWNGIIPPWATKRQMEELKIPNESRKVHCNSHASHDFSPWMA